MKIGPRIPPRDIVVEPGIVGCGAAWLGNFSPTFRSSASPSSSE